ncbi:MAG: class I SAM-dependent methyltransferase [Gammaproteobacteria bacterium]
MHSSHAALDLAGRKPKAEKIRRLIPISNYSQGTLRLLEVGTGSGAIAQYFASLASPHFDVWAVDVEDQRVATEGYQFRPYDGRKLPFDDEFFDLVISNHVIEHVGGRAQQASHISELCRVLRPGGYIYLATPSRWQLIEPHFSLPFLSWIPRRWRDRYVQVAGKGERYDCDLLRPVELQRLLEASGLPYQNLNIRALFELMALEHPKGMLVRLASRMPMRWLERLRNLSPTMIYLIHKQSSLDASEFPGRKSMSPAPTQPEHQGE